MLDTLMHRRPDGTVKITIYQKPTHTNQYLDFQSHHPLQHKLSVVRTLHHRADTCVTEETDKIEEKLNIRHSLKICGYKDWVFETAKPQDREATPRSFDAHTHHNKGSVVLPYVRGASEALRRIFNKRGITVHFKPQNTLRSLLVAPKDRTPISQCSNVVYQICCKDCRAAYVGESARSISVRAKEHRTSSAIASLVFEHMEKGHNIDWDNIKILDKESD